MKKRNEKTLKTCTICVGFCVKFGLCVFSLAFIDSNSFIFTSLQFFFLIIDKFFYFC